jgi:hypothetical protein
MAALKSQCMQTIRFSNQSPFVDDALRANQKAQMFLQPQIKTCIDLSSKYLVLSDLTRKCFYVLNLLTDVENDKAKFTAISEFILAYPAVSFAIIDSRDIETRKNNQLNNVKTNNNNASLINEELDRKENNLSISAANHMINANLSSSSTMLPQLSQQAQAQDSENNYATMIRLYCIQTKQLQEMTIFLNSEKSVNAYNNSLVSPTPQLNTAIESSGVLLASASQNGSNSSLLLSKMNALEFESDAEQDTAKMNSFFDVEVNKLSRSDNSVTPFLNSPNNVSNERESPSPSLTQVTSNTNLTSLSEPAHGTAQNQSADKEIAAFIIYSPKSIAAFLKISWEMRYSAYWDIYNEMRTHPEKTLYKIEFFKSPESNIYQFRNILFENICKILGYNIFF